MTWDGCSPDKQPAGEERNGDEVEARGKDGLHGRDHEAAVYNELTQRRWTLVADNICTATYLAPYYTVIIQSPVSK